MDRIKGGWLLLAASVLGLLLLTGALYPAKTLSAYSVDAGTWENLQAGRIQADRSLLEELTFNDYALWRDTATGRYFYSLIENDPHAWDPPVAWRGTGGSVRLAVQEASITPEGIAAGQPLHVMAYDDTSYSLYEVACTTLPLLGIAYGYDGGPDGLDGWVGDGSWISLFDNRAGATQRLLTDVPGISHFRGNGTLAYPKKGYRLTLLDESLGDHLREYDAALLGLRQDGDWLLYAGYNDRERVRNVFCSELWYTSCARHNACGITNGMEYRYVELFIGGEYWGLYALGYPLDALQFGLAQDLAGNYTEYLYKPWRWSAGDREGYELVSQSGDPQLAWDAFTDFQTALMTGTDPETLYGIADIGNAIDIYLFYNLIQSCDSVWGPKSNAPSPEQLYNTFLCMKQQDGGTQFLFTPWDMDMTWGNHVLLNGFNRVGEYGLASADDYIMQSNPVARLQALGDERINTLVKQRYRELRSGAWSDETLLTMLDGLERRIFDSGAYVRDIERWPDSCRETPETRLSVFKAYVFERLGHMDAFVEALP